MTNVGGKLSSHPMSIACFPLLEQYTTWNLTCKVIGLQLFLAGVLAKRLIAECLLLKITVEN
jgi:hypothetical protein